MRCRAFSKHRTVMENTLPLPLKSKVFNQCILPVLMYRSETASDTGLIKNSNRTESLQETFYNYEEQFTVPSEESKVSALD